MQIHLPGHVLDGVTLTLPLYLLNRVEPAVINWLVPGLIREKLILLLKSLPKDKRRPLIPLPDAVTVFLSVAKPGEQTLTDALAVFIRKKTGADIRHEDWTSELPLHLQMNLRVVDDSGQELASSRDLLALRQQLGGAASITYGSQTDEGGFEQAGLTGWTFGDLPEQVKFSRGGRELIGFPALVDTGEAVDLRLLDTAETAEQATRRGVVRLLRLALAAQFKQLDKDLARETALAMKYRNFGNADVLRMELTDAIASRALLGEDDLYLHHSKVNAKAAIEGSVWPWHQDFGAWHLDGIQRLARLERQSHLALQLLPERLEHPCHQFLQT